MVTLERLVQFLDAHLEVAKFEDSALNGLQVEGRPDVRRIVLGVSISHALLQRAEQLGADAVITHHGLLWGKALPIVGPLRLRLAALLGGEISLLAYHLPLDAHPEDGNNARIAAVLGLGETERWGLYHGSPIGRIGSSTSTLGELVARLEAAISARPLVLGAGPCRVSRVAVCSGGAGSMLDQAIAARADVFVTGEPGEPAQELAREAGIAVVAGGHYATERFGVRALGERLAAELDVETLFVDIPNPV